VTKGYLEAPEKKGPGYEPVIVSERLAAESLSDTIVQS
jgi:hypothetical protein